MTDVEESALPAHMTPQAHWRMAMWLERILAAYAHRKRWGPPMDASSDLLRDVLEQAEADVETRMMTKQWGIGT